MNSFIFPEDLDYQPHRAISNIAPPTKKLQDALPAPSAKRARPAPIILPSTFDYNAIHYKPKDEVVVSVARFSLDERSPRLQKPKEKTTSTLTRWKSATLSKQDKQDRNARMTLAEAECANHASARYDNGMRSSRYGALSPLSEQDGWSGQNGWSEQNGCRKQPPIDYGIHYAAF